MTVLDVKTEAELNEVLSSNDKVVVNFHAPAWCNPCRRLAPHYEAVAEYFAGVKFVHVDVDTADRALVDSYQIAGVPKVYAFKAGEKVAEITKRTAPSITTELVSIYP